MIRVTILHETHLIGNAMASVLGNEPDITIAGLASTFEDALSQLSSTVCDVLLVNAQRPNQEVLDFIQRTNKQHKDTKIVLIGVVEAEEFILQCFQAGASGYALRDESLEDLVQKMRAVHEGKTLLSPKIACALVSRIAELSQCVTMDSMPGGDDLRLLCSELTPREREVLRFIERGCSNQEIAESLTIEVGTVKNHVHNILKKLNVDNRKRAAVLARQFLDLQERPAEMPRQLWKSSYSMYTTGRVSEERMFAAD